LATQSIADGPLAGHAVSGTLWLFAALIVVIGRFNRAEPRPVPAGEERALVQLETKSDPPYSRPGPRAVNP